ncbi:hypothetical protein ABTY20_32680, partial [Streptomyces sp. NPDC126497]|uniref:hypothetical protein n=1 Tax=Streptomyces sp. NPDC126497 TaxID=3155313 RepID=UPI0033275B4B
MEEASSATVSIWRNITLTGTFTIRDAAAPDAVRQRDRLLPLLAPVPGAGGRRGQGGRGYGRRGGGHQAAGR